MASGRRGGAGERVLEGRHVIGLFFLMLLFSGVFFTLGYVMGRNQLEGQVRAAESTRDMNTPIVPRPDSGKRNTGVVNPDPAPASEVTPSSPSSDWEFYRAGEKKASDDHLKPAPAVTPRTVSAKSNVPSRVSPAASRPGNNTSGRGSYLLQVAALTREGDAMALASTLQKKRFPAYVMSPQGDKFYRVQVGPYSDQKSADAARKGLDAAGFKAIVKH